MTILTEILTERIANWPKEALTELFKAIDEIEAKYVGVYKLDAEERAAIDEAKAQAARGEFASDEEVAAFFNRCLS
jgi:choline kinase